MLLLTFTENAGVQSVHRVNYTEAQRKAFDDRTTKAFVTRLSLGEALITMSEYEAAYRAKYRLYVEYSLISVTGIDDLSKDEREAGHIEMVEDLPQAPEDFG